MGSTPALLRRSALCRRRRRAPAGSQVEVRRLSGGPRRDPRSLTRVPPEQVVSKAERCLVTAALVALRLSSAPWSPVSCEAADSPRPATFS